MPHRKPWFLRAKKFGDYSHLRWNDFNELRDTVSDAVREHSDSGWKKIKTAALIALAELGEKHGCSFNFNVEGGHICLYKDGDPVFALRIGAYSRHRVEDLLKGKALYRGIVDIVPSSPPPPLRRNPSKIDKASHELEWSWTAYVEPLKVFYYRLPISGAGKWKNKEAIDLCDVIETVKAHPGSSRSDIQHVLNLSPNKLVRLLGFLKSRRILRHRGCDRTSGWYLN